MRRLLVNDCLTCIPGTRTFWHDLQEWFGMDFVEAPYDRLATVAEAAAKDAGLIIRNASWFPPIAATAPQIALLQDIMGGPGREMQEAVVKSARVVFNSRFTQSKYNGGTVIPLPVDFDLFKPGNPMGLQHELGLPSGAVCWVGASQGAAGQIKGFDVFLQMVRLNPDVPFVAVFKDTVPPSIPPNLRCYVRVTQEELARIMGACVVGLCTSRMETQHLAGIEMGACGLPVVVPPVGTYWERKDIPGMVVSEGTPEAFMTAVRAMMYPPKHAELVREYWRKEFSREVVRSAWTKLVEEVECSGQS